MRFAGDFADYGEEIQISDFAKGSGSWHVSNQSRFMGEVERRVAHGGADDAQRVAESRR